MDSNQISKACSILFEVYTSIDKNQILDAKFPSKTAFFEPTISKINYSFLKFLDSKIDYEETNISRKQSDSLYSTIYELFHDLKLACLVKILEYENSIEAYTEIDTFYKVSIELLLREALRIGVSLKEDRLKAANEGNTEDEKSLTDLEESLSKDFDIITTTFFNKTGETISIFASGNVPLFTSMNKNKSELDDREPVIDPSLAVNLIKVIPNIKVPSNDKLGPLSNVENKLPNIKQILENYMHPNWLRLISSQWLKHGDGINALNFSFAPTYDETKSIISNEWKGLTWCQQVGFNKLVDAKEKYEKLVNVGEDNIEINENKAEPETKSEAKSEANFEAEEDKEKNEIEGSSKFLENGTELKIDESNSESDEKIDLLNLFNWAPNNNISEDESELIESNKVQTTINLLLLELNELRKKRLATEKTRLYSQKKTQNSNDFRLRPSKLEMEKYYKVKRLITGLIQSKNVKPDELDLKFDPMIPVLQHSYCGTLPSNYMSPVQKAFRPVKRRR